MKGKGLHIEKSPHWPGDKKRQRRGFRDSEESTATGLQGEKQREREICTDSFCHCLACTSLRCSSTGAGQDWVLRLELWRSDSRIGLELAVWR